MLSPKRDLRSNKKKLETPYLFQEYFDVISLEAQDFVMNTLQAQPHRRICLEACKNHPWLQARDYLSSADPGSPVCLDTERLEAFIQRRKNTESDVKPIPNDIISSCVATWNQSLE